MVVTIKLWNNNKLLNIMKIKSSFLCVKKYFLKIMEDVTVRTLKVGIRKVEHVKLFSVKYFSF